MATGFTKDGAVQEQIDASIEDAVQLARRRLPQGVGLDRCEECGAIIPDARRAAIPGVRLCVSCQSEHDQTEQFSHSYNRRANKDSQLR